MSSIDNLAKDLVKIMHKTDEKGPKPYEPIATVVKEDENNGDILWVKIPGSDSDTPVEKTVSASPGDRVRVRVSGGRAWVVGNASNPPTDDTRAIQAQQTAITASEEASRAKEAADEAWMWADSAHEAADTAWDWADEAHTQAVYATGYANDALTQLGVVEQVVDTLNWISEHGVYKKTEDTEVIENKLYFTLTGIAVLPSRLDDGTRLSNLESYYEEINNIYVHTTDTTYNTSKRYYTVSATLVEHPEGNPSTQNYYEIFSVDKAVENYISSHLALTDAGLYVVKDNNGYKILLANDGLKIYDDGGHLVSSFGENIVFDSTRPQRIGNNSTYLKWYDSNSDGIADKIEISGDVNITSSVTIGGVPTNDDLINAINGVHVGGRNLVLKTGTMPTSGTGSFRASGGVVSHVDVSGTFTSGITGGIRVTNNGTSAARVGFAQDNRTNTFIAGQKYTMSCWIRASASMTTTVTLQPIWITGGSAAKDIANVSLSTDWKWVSVEGLVLSGSQQPSYSCGYVYVSNIPANGWFEVCGIKVEEGNKATDWTPAPEDVQTEIDTAQTTADAASPKSSAVAKTQRIYYRSNSSTKPTAYPTAWVTEEGNKWNSNATTASGWSRKVTPISNGTDTNVTKYLYLWTATQKQMVDGTVVTLTASDIALDDSTTVIDGGKIITSSITANQLAANSITIGNMDSEAKASVLNSKVYNIGVNNGQAGWHFLGILTLSGQTDEADIEIHTGDGQNNSGYQNLTLNVNIKRGYTPTTSATAGITVRYEGDPTIIHAAETNCYVEARCTSIGVLNIYLYTSWNYADGWYQVKGRGWSWVHKGTLVTTAPSEGTAQDITKMNPYTTATSYITKVDENGITIHPSGTTANRLLLTSNGMNLYQGNVSVAYYGASSRIGREDQQRVTINPSGIDMYGYNASASTPNENLCHLGFESGTAQSGTDIKPYFTFGYRDTSYSTTKGNYSVAMGYRTQASGWNSIALGPGARAAGNNSIALGSSSIASNTDSCGIGGGNCTGYYAVAIINGSSASGEYSAAIGRGITTAYSNQIAVGKYNSNGSGNAFEVGWGTTSTHKNIFHVTTAGAVYVNGTSVHSSDRRLKEHLGYLGDEAVDFINGLKPAHYIKDGSEHVGFYAQDVEKIDKWNCMIGEKMNGYMTLGYMELFAPLVTYVQKLEERIKELERRP